MSESLLKIIPLGGCGEIGMNMTVLSIGDTHYFIDAGALFPDASNWGVDLILPSTKYIDESKIWPEAWLITHGHEDHIGALPYLFKKYPAPIYGTEFTIELIKAKFKDNDIDNAVFNVWNVYKTFYFKNLKVTPFTVNHSIADAAGLLFETPSGNILHMGDFRIDYSPPESSMTHENVKKVINNKPIKMMMSDSTNSFQVGTDFSENDIRLNIGKYFTKNAGFVIIVTFASNIWRLQTIFDSVRDAGRKAVLFGRSLHRNVEIAVRLGLLNVSGTSIIDISEIKNYPRNEICILSTGSQGESFSGLHRIAWNNVPEIKIEEPDTVIFSSRMIPGNEKNIESVVTQLIRLGCSVVTSKDDPFIHVSGHGYQEDLKACILAANPESFLPVHGTFRHLKKHRELAIQCGISSDKCYLAENGDVVLVGPHSKGVVNQVKAGRDYVCPGGIFPSDHSVYKERVALVSSGFIAVSYVIDSQEYELIANPEISMKGVSLNEQGLIKNVEALYKKTFEQSKLKKKFNDDILKEDLRIAIRKHVEHILKYKCLVVIAIHKLDVA